MEIGLALVVTAALGWWLGRRRHRRKRDLVEEAGGFLAGGVPVVLSQRDDDVQRDLEEGALDPDELEDDPVHWDEGADDEPDTDMS